MDYNQHHPHENPGHLARDSGQTGKVHGAGHQADHQKHKCTHWFTPVYAMHVEQSSGTWGRHPGHLHQQTMTRSCSRSEKLWLREYGDWGIGHAGKGSGAREMGQSASFFLARSLWAQYVRESSIIMLTEEADDLGMAR